LGSCMSILSPEHYPSPKCLRPRTFHIFILAQSHTNLGGVQWSVRDDALLIDLGKLQCLELDPTGSVLKASPSTTGRVLNTFLAKKGKMFAGGHCPDVGIGGFVLQGGMSWNCKVRRFLRV